MPLASFYNFSYKHRKCVFRARGYRFSLTGQINTATETNPSWINGEYEVKSLRKLPDIWLVCYSCCITKTAKEVSGFSNMCLISFCLGSNPGVTVYNNVL